MLFLFSLSSSSVLRSARSEFLQLFSAKWAYKLPVIFTLFEERMQIGIRFVELGVFSLSFLLCPLGLGYLFGGTWIDLHCINMQVVWFLVLVVI